MSLQSKTGEKELHNSQLEKLEKITKEARLQAARRRFYEMLKCPYNRSDLLLSQSMDDIDTCDQELSTRNCDPQLFPGTSLEYDDDGFNCHGSLCNLYDICNVFNEEYEIFKLDGSGSADDSDSKSPKALACLKISSQELLSASNKEADNMVKSQRSTTFSRTNYSLTEMECDTGYSQHNLVTIASKISSQSISASSTKRPDSQTNKDMSPPSRKVNTTRELLLDSAECCNFHETDFDIFKKIDPITMDYICQGDRNEEKGLKNNSENQIQESIKPLPQIFYWAKTLRRDINRLNHDIHSNFNEDASDYYYDFDDDSDEYFEYELDQDGDTPFEECCTAVWERYYDAPQEQMSDLNTMLTESFRDVLALLQTTSLESVDSEHPRDGSGRMNQSTPHGGVRKPERQTSKSGNRGNRKNFISAMKKAGGLKNVRHEPVKFQQTPQKKLKSHSAPVDNASATSITRNLKMMRGERRAGGSTPHASPDRQQSKSSLKGSMIAKIFKPKRNTQSPNNRKQSRSNLMRSKVSNAKLLTPVNKQRVALKEASKSKTVAPRRNSTVSKKNQKPRSTPTTPPSRGKELKDRPQLHTARPHQRPKSAVKCPTKNQHGKSPRRRDQERSQKTGRITSPQKRR